MSKQITPRLIVLLFASVFLAGLFLIPPSSAQRSPAPQHNPVASGPARNAALVAATQTVLKETSEIRQLPILRSVHSSTQTRVEIERMIIRNLDEESTPAEMHADEVTLKKLGLAPAEFQYRPFLIKLLTEQVAGYYDSKEREFHLADWIDLDGQKPIMAHELTHALQDQHFNLRRFEPWPQGDSDAEMAAHALIEGDATLTMMLYVASDPMRALAFLKSLSATGMATAELDKAPRALRESLLFPYQQGTDWTRVLYKRGGWALVSKAFTDLPQSTEQIMHSEKYFAREAPVKVTLPDITGLLNANGSAEVRGQRSEVGGQWAVSSGHESVSSGRWAVGSTQPVSFFILHRSSFSDNSSLMTHHPSLPNISSFILHPSSFGSNSYFRSDSLLPTAHRPLLTDTWRRINYDVNGEWGFYLLLDQFLKSPAESRRAAAGWGGDRYEVYESSTGEVLIASLSTWDTERDAREFFDAYVKRTSLRYPGAERLDLGSAVPNPKSGIDSPASGFQPPASAASWRTAEGQVNVDLRGTRVIILEGIPANLDPNILLKALDK